MIVLRKLVSSSIAVVAVLFVCVAVLEMFFWRAGVEHTIANAREIERAFGEASAFVDGFTKSHGRLPAAPEFSAWTATQPESVHSARTFYLLTSPSQFPDEIIQKFGKPVPHSYVLQYWRGEWFECYASWAKTSTLELDPKAFYLLGNPVVDGIALLTLGLLLAAIARGIWPSSTPSIKSDASR